MKKRENEKKREWKKERMKEERMEIKWENRNKMRE